MVCTVTVIGLIPASFAACVVLIHIIWVVVRDLIQENVDLSFLLGECCSKWNVFICSVAKAPFVVSYCYRGHAIFVSSILSLFLLLFPIPVGGSAVNSP